MPLTEAWRKKHDKNQPRLEFGQEPEPTLEERFAALPDSERILATAIAKNKDGLVSVLDAVSNARMPSWLPLDVVCMVRDQLDGWMKDGRFWQIAEYFEQLGVRAEGAYPRAGFEWIALVETRRAYKKALMQEQADSPETVLANLKGPFQLEEIERVIDYAIIQGLISRSEIDNDWRQLAPKTPMDTAGLPEPRPVRVFRAFLLDAELPLCRLRARQRLQKETTNPPMQSIARVTWK